MSTINAMNFAPTPRRGVANLLTWGCSILSRPYELLANSPPRSPVPASAHQRTPGVFLGEARSQSSDGVPIAREPCKRAVSLDCYVELLLPNPSLV